MENVFVITDFGAVGDGKTDCTAAIQSALDEAAAVSGKVVVPPGVFMTVGGLKMRGKGVSLCGTPAWSFRNDGASVLKLCGDKADCMLDISGAFGCTIHGICMNGAGLGENIHGLKLYWDRSNGGGQEDTPTVDDCRIGNFTGDGLHFEHAWCFSVRHSMIYGNGGAGLLIAGWDAFIIDNWFTSNRNGGIRSGGYVASITATGNRVEWNRTGGFIIERGDSFNFTGNFFDRTFGPALELGRDGIGVNLATVTGNVFRRGGAYEEKPFENPEKSSHMILDGCTGCVITGNTMKVGAGDGGVLPVSPDYGVIMRNCENSILKENAMHNGSLKNNLIEENNTCCIIADNVGCLYSGD